MLMPVSSPQKIRAFSRFARRAIFLLLLVAAPLGTVLGYLWSLIRPLTMFGVLLFVFTFGIAVVANRIVFMLPGSEDAVRLAMGELIIPELGHIVRELTK